MADTGSISDSCDRNDKIEDKKAVHDEGANEPSQNGMERSCS
jgi:hypothetical protein